MIKSRKYSLVLIPLFLCLYFASASFSAYAQQDLKTIRKDSKTEMEKKKQITDKQTLEKKHIRESIEIAYYTDAILRNIRDSILKWQEKGEFEKKENWNIRLKEESSKIFARSCNSVLSKLIRDKYGYDNSCFNKADTYYDINLLEYNSENEYFPIIISCNCFKNVDSPPFYYSWHDREMKRKWEGKQIWEHSKFNPESFKKLDRKLFDSLKNSYFSYIYSFRLKIPISEAAVFKSKMLTYAKSMYSYDKYIFFNFCFFIPTEPSNFIFFHHYPIPKVIVFAELDINDVFNNHYLKYDRSKWSELTNEYELKDSISWERPMHVINILKDHNPQEITDIIIYFDDLELDNPYLKGSCYNYTKQKFFPSPAMAKQEAEEKAKQQKLKAEQERQQKNDSIFQQVNNTLQQAVSDYHALLKRTPYNRNENEISLSISKNLIGKNQKLSDTLNLLLDSIQSKRYSLLNRYTADSIFFAQQNKILQTSIDKANAQLLEYPYNLQKRTINDSLPFNLFGKQKELEKVLQIKQSALPEMIEQIKTEVYTTTKTYHPQQFTEVYFTQNPQQKQRADSTYLECRCKYGDRLSFDLAFIDNALSTICNCRETKYQEVKELYHSREEFDQAYNHPENEFEQELSDRRKMFQLLKALENDIVSQKSIIYFFKAQSSTRPQVIEIIDNILKHRNSYYYSDAIDLVFRYNGKLSKEWEKNGCYFRSKAEMFEYWIGDEYDKELKNRKKNK